MVTVTVEVPRMKIDTRGLVAAVAEAIFESTRIDGEGWDDLTSDEKRQFSDVAEHAVAGMTGWLASQGLLIQHQGTVKHPRTLAEANAMMAVAMAWIKVNEKSIVIKPSLILPA